MHERNARESEIRRFAAIASNAGGVRMVMAAQQPAWSEFAPLRGDRGGGRGNCLARESRAVRAALQNDLGAEASRAPAARSAAESAQRIQRIILKDVLERAPVHACAMAFRKGRGGWITRGCTRPGGG